MIPRKVRRQLRVKRKALRQELARRRAKARERRRTARRQRRRALDDGRVGRRRRWFLLALAVALLLLLLRDCRCDEQQAAAPLKILVRSVPVPPVPKVDVPTPPPLSGQIDKRSRAEYESAPAGPRPWVASFRMQVAARSPRLAGCFEGAKRPGMLRWTAAVDPAHGVVADHSLEPTLLSDELSKEQYECLVRVLSQPAYNLTSGDEPATPSRVGIVIEF